MIPQDLAAITHIIGYLGAIIGMLAAGTLFWGVVVGVSRLVRLEIAHLRGANIRKQQEILRQDVAYYILLGLEFLIAADIIHTIAVGLDFQTLALLAGIVLIRTFISHFLTRDVHAHFIAEPDEPRESWPGSSMNGPRLARGRWARRD